MNKYEIIWSTKAKKELSNIYTHITYVLKENYIAINIIKKIINLTSNLNTFPERYSKIFYYIDKSRNLRKLPLDKYVIIYEIDNISRESLHITYISLQSKLFKSFIIILYFLSHLSYLSNSHVKQSQLSLKTN